ncbi:hypothetical protein FH972_026994 [Carpinus fangiana]|uniref:Uncharacterized protein n=1 Tax=Carpinus fangiana TaxID=176857 RepID=A0A5N6L5N9_9ROSI|nr:hypothetical protein FH972_026994 [Carpinus fangiana]
MDSKPVDFSPNLSFPPSVNQEEIFQELDGEGQQPIEVDPSTPDSDLFDLDKEGDKITFYEDAIYDLVHELREEEKRPLADEPHRINQAIDRVRENLSTPDKQESENLGMKNLSFRALSLEVPANAYGWKLAFRRQNLFLSDIRSKDMLICLYLPDSLIFPPSPDPSSSRRRKDKSNTIYGRLGIANLPTREAFSLSG